MKKKICRKCNEEKVISEFHKNKKHKDGLHSFCKQCAIAGAKKHYADNASVLRPKMNEYSKEKTKRLRNVTDAIKEETGCALCDEADPCCMDFHHINDDKDRDISYLAHAKSIKRLIQEINKCVCVCSNCHRKIHAGRLSTEGLSPISLEESSINIPS